MKRYLILALLSVSGIAGAIAVKFEAEVAKTSRSVELLEQAFHRKYSQLDPNGVQPLADTAENWFPAFGFAPSEAGFAFDVSPLDNDSMSFCVAREVTTPIEWSMAVKALGDKGFRPSSDTCLTGQSWEVPAQYPFTIYGEKQLNRLDVLTRTVVNFSHVTVSGFNQTAVTVPAITLTAAAAATSAPVVLTVTNPLRYQLPDGSSCTQPDSLVNANCQPVSSSLIVADVREGFSASHNCQTIMPGGSCSISLSYSPGAERVKVGALRLEFSTGEYATIGVAGRKS